MTTSDCRAVVRPIWDECDAVWQEPERLGGAYVFDGTRVPISALFENLNDGVTVDEFLKLYPGVERSQVEQVLDCQLRRIQAALRPFERTPRPLHTD